MKHQIIIVAPYPDVRIVSGGWMSRIKAVDRIFSDIPRVYVNFGDHHRKDADGHPVSCEPGVVQYNLNANEPAHQMIFDQLQKEATLGYIHTVHLAIDVMDWLPTGKFIVDIHGIVPEEEIMLGRPDQAEKFLPVENSVLHYCKNLVVVTSAMQDHLLKKYPSSSANFITLPIFEEYRRDRRLIDPDSDNKRLRVIYAGGTQVWQNVDLMFDIASSLHEYLDFTFISQDEELLRNKAAALGLSDRITIRYATKEELPSVYAEQDLGFVLRDDTAVNTVSCPTKLSEYLDFGIIPVVKHVSLGDFEKYGYSYLTEEDLRALMVPDALTRSYMLQNNYGTIQKLINEYKAGSSKLLNLVKG
jgi:hypothetical protein